MITWGIVANSHDASIGVFDEDTPVWAGMAKDFSGKPNDAHLNWQMIQHIRINEGLRPDRIVWYEYPRLKGLRQWWAGQGLNWKENNIPKYLSQWNIYQPIEYTKHHLSHAAYGYYTSGLKDASIFVADSIGEFECLTIWKGEGDKLTKVFSQSYPHSLGLFYSAMTQRCGLEPNKDEYKMYELGRGHRNQKIIKSLVKDMIYIHKDKWPKIKFKLNLHKGARHWRPEITNVGSIAYATQWLFEESLKIYTKAMKDNLPSNNLIVMGGCALNKQAIEVIKPKWDKVWIPPNPGDPGSCIGAVLAKGKKHIDFNPKIWYNSK